MTTIIRYPQQPLSILQAGCVATIGKFDALHLGHQSMLQRLLQHAQVLALPSVVIVFEPYPIEFFKGQQAPPRLTELRDKYHYLCQLGIDYLILLRFDEAMARLAPQTFVTHYLQNIVPVKMLLVGQDFRFGHRRQGDVDLLQQLLTHTAQVEIASDYQVEDVKVSSSLIRNQLQLANVKQAQHYLGRNYTVTGRVVHGEKRGRTINFPTINIPLKRRLALQYGVYAVRVAGLSNTELDGVASVGVRPVVKGKEPLLEVFLFDFDQEVYGQLVTVQFVEFIRPEWHFDGLQALKEQISQDVQKAQIILLPSSF